MRDQGEDLRKVINRHGYAFQQALLRKAGELFEARRSRWVFDSEEVPVEVRSGSTRIDFLLHQYAWNSAGPVRYLIAEASEPTLPSLGGVS